MRDLVEGIATNRDSMCDFERVAGHRSLSGPTAGEHIVCMIKY